ncbi:hypothetical protein AD428_19305 [Achromobacter sp. DMS1]|nr:hypothetical protein AD428_19305 [Achromobacter sp. DMS1]
MRPRASRCSSPACCPASRTAAAKAASIRAFRPRRHGRARAPAGQCAGGQHTRLRHAGNHAGRPLRCASTRPPVSRWPAPTWAPRSTACPGWPPPATARWWAGPSSAAWTATASGC